jgi:hypothetical protein
LRRSRTADSSPNAAASVTQSIDARGATGRAGTECSACWIRGGRPQPDTTSSASSSNARPISRFAMPASG